MASLAATARSTWRRPISATSSRSCQNRGFAGGNVTIPHKEAAFRRGRRPRRGRRNDRRRQHAVARGRRSSSGGNTDAQGFAANLDERAPGWRKSGASVVLGAGGAARAVHPGAEASAASATSGWSTVRSSARSSWRTVSAATSPRIGLDGDAGNARRCRPAGQHDFARHAWQRPNCPPIPHFCRGHAIVTDIVYVPLETPLLLAARAARAEDGRRARHAAASGGAGVCAMVRQAARGDGELRELIVADIRAQDMIVLGLTGSIGMGKSTTAQMFAEAGVPVHDSDEAVHRLYAGAAAPLVEAAFPGTVVDGVVDRAKLAQRVLGDQQAIAAAGEASCIRWCAPTRTRSSPASRSQVRRWSCSIFRCCSKPAAGPRRQGRGGHRAAEVQRERVLSRPGMTPEKFAAILARQVPDAEKRRRADFVIDTGRGHGGGPRAGACDHRRTDGEKPGRAASLTASPWSILRRCGVIRCAKSSSIPKRPGWIANQDRIIELGGIELVNRFPTGRIFHHYINPQGRLINAEAQAVHGISAADLAGQADFR